MNPTFLRRLAMISTVVAALGFPTAVGGQVAPYATVALARGLPDTTDAVIVVRNAEQPLILLRERDADAAALATAMRSLYRNRERAANNPGGKLVIRIRGHEPDASLTPNERQLANIYLGRLRAARPESIDEIGTARATRIPLVAAATTGRR